MYGSKFERSGKRDKIDDGKLHRIFKNLRYRGNYSENLRLTQNERTNWRSVGEYFTVL